MLSNYECYRPRSVEALLAFFSKGWAGQRGFLTLASMYLAANELLIGWDIPRCAEQCSASEMRAANPIERPTGSGSG